MLAAQLHANEVRQRLRNPPNAVPDYGIDLKRKPIPCVQLVVVNDPKPEPVDEVFGPAIAKSLDEIAFGPIVHPADDTDKHPRVEDIIRAVSQYTKVSKTDICSGRRTANIIMPRHIAMYLARTLTLRSLPDIGRRFGGRDHSSVLSAVRKIEGLRQTDAALDATINAIAESLR